MHKLTIISCMIILISIVWFASEQKVIPETNISDSVDLVMDDDFVILNIGDLQFSDGMSSKDKENAKSQIHQLIMACHPDLITMTGDQTYTNASISSFYEVVNFMESLNIPWAPIMGNHEEEGLSRLAKAEVYSCAKNCLYRYGTLSAGDSDYQINIYQDNQIKYSLLMMDTHNMAYYEELDQWGYAAVNESQIAWYTTKILELQKAGTNPVSLVFIHHPLYEYRLAYEYWQMMNCDPAIGWGTVRETINAPLMPSGFFARMYELASTKYVFAGHDHINNFSLTYHGINLNYVLKTGKGCYYDSELQGGTVITLGDDIRVTQIVLEEK